MFLDIFFVNEENGWACGRYNPSGLHKGVILKTEDGGGNWELNLENTSGAIGLFRTIQFLDENLGWASGSDNQIFKTTNGGDTWAATVIDPALGDGETPLLVHAHFFVNDTLGWLSCLPLETYRHFIYITQDGGTTWHRQSIERDSFAENIFMTSPTTGYAVTRLGRVLRYEARPAECGALPIFPSANSENIHLQPLLHWHPAPGGTDGYRIALGTSPGAEDLLPLTDVGLDTFFLLPTPLPSNTTVHASIYPYSQYFGEAGCSDAFSFTTVACPAPTVVEAGICKNGSLLFADSLITAAGLYEWTYALPSGCDSLVQLAVSQYPDVVTTIDTTLLIGQPFNGIVYGQDTTLEFALQTVHGCDSLVRVNLQLVTSTKEPRPSLTAVQLFPNPAAEAVTLRFEQAPTGAVRLYLFNDSGQTVLRQKLPAQQDHYIDLSGLPAGSYRVVVMANGQVVAVSKLVLI